jgi:hypothetical protein
MTSMSGWLPKIASATTPRLDGREGVEGEHDDLPSPPMRLAT